QKTSGNELSLANWNERNGNAYAPATPANANWNLIPDGTGYYLIQNASSGMYINVSGGLTANGANVAVWDTHVGDHYLVKFLPQGGGFYKPQFKHSAKMLCTFSASDGSNVQQCDDSTSDLVEWRFQ